MKKCENQKIKEDAKIRDHVKDAKFKGLRKDDKKKD